MKQISQSQFISISDTLCEIVKGLNESQIAATFECVVSRLCSSFDSVVIPPMAAIKKSLDLLVGEQRLDFINGSYYFKSAVLLRLREKLTTSPQAPEIETQGPNRSSLSSKKGVTEEKRYIQRENLKGRSFENENVKERTKTKKFENAGTCTQKKQKEPGLDQDLSFTRKNNRKCEKNKVVKSSSLKVHAPNHCIPRGQYSYEELHSHAEQRELRGKIKKRNSFLGKFSRLFKMEGGKFISNDETEDEFDDDICHEGWEKIVTDEQAKLISNKMEVKQKHALAQLRENKNRLKAKRTKERSVVSTKQLKKTKHSENLSRAPRLKSVKGDKSRPPRYSKQYSSRSSRTSTNASSRSRSPHWLNTNFAHRNKNIAEQKAEWNSSQTREQEEKRRTSEQQKSPERYSLSSYSDSSCSNQNNSDYSLSSESSIELNRKSFHYSEEDTTDVESQQGCWEDGASNFCSTQAICGDLERSTLSLNPTNKTTSSSDSASIKHVEKHSVIKTAGANKNRTLDHDLQQSNLRGRNLVQLIGIL